jgi:hypothetical protein
MSRLSTLKDKIRYRIRKSKENVFLIKDFMDLSGRDQILRALRALIAEQEILRLGKGIYTKARKSSLSGKIIPTDNLRNITLAAMRKLGVEILPTKAEQSYNNKETTQVPNGFIIGVNKRVSRKISFERTTISYETIN